MFDYTLNNFPDIIMVHAWSAVMTVIEAFDYWWVVKNRILVDGYDVSMIRTIINTSYIVIFINFSLIWNERWLLLMNMAIYRTLKSIRDQSRKLWTQTNPCSPSKSNECNHQFAMLLINVISYLQILNFNHWRRFLVSRRWIQSHQ